MLLPFRPRLIWQGAVRHRKVETEGRDRACKKAAKCGAPVCAQAQALFLRAGVPGRGPRREALLQLLAVALNLTHNNDAGAEAVLGAGGLGMAAGLLGSVLGPPEEEAALVRIADRRAALTPGLHLILVLSPQSLFEKPE